METIFTGSYKTIEEFYGVIITKLSGFKSQLFFTDLLQNWYIYSTYPT